MSDESLDLPDCLKFTPNYPQSTGCTLGYHQAVWSEKLLKIGDEIYQVGRCRKCGLVGKEPI